MGRPRKPIDLELVEKLAALQCTGEEIAAIVKCTPRSLQRHPETMAAIARGREHGKVSLRRLQWKVAQEKESVAMLIWLGKQWLGQSERVRVGGENESPLIPFDLIRAVTAKLDHKSGTGGASS